jgi:membrane-bound metal-dependent hydrolase YbcI (DUF457 family)
MMTSTHAPIGVASWLTTATLLGDHIDPIIVGVGAVLAWTAAKIPDIDNPNSDPGRQLDKLVPGLPAWLAQTTGHRGITHWGITAIGAGVVFALLGGAVDDTLWWLGVAVGLGWITHVIGDCLTWNGAPLLAPFTRRTTRPPYGYRIRVNGPFERQVIRPAARLWALTEVIMFASTLFN